MDDQKPIQKGYKFRLYPTAEQEVMLGRHFGCGRFVYNYFLNRRQEHYHQTGKTLSYHQMAEELTALKQQIIWLRDANAQALQQKLIDLNQAFKNFFQRIKKRKHGQPAGKPGYPCFKSKKGYQSLRVPQAFRLEGEMLIIPKVSPIRIVLHRPFAAGAILKSVTISRQPSGRYFAAFLVEEPQPETRKRDGVVGVDLGISSYIVTSAGHKEPAPKHYVKAQKKLRRVKREHSRRKQAGQNREKTRIKIARQEERIANQRADFLHKQSIRLIRESQTIGLEDLAVKNLLKNRKLAKHIQDAAWGTFVRMLEYKAGWYGSEIRKVNRFFPSTQLCSNCGYKNAELTLADREWTCPQCRLYHDRDINSAINILIEISKTTVGHTGSHACGEYIRPAVQADLVETGTFPRERGSRPLRAGG